MFVLKKILAPFFFPVPLSLEFLTAGLLLLWFTRRQRAGRVLATCATVLFMCLSSGPISRALLRPLERSYPPLDPAHATVPAAPFIVVLGGFGDRDPDVPITSHLSAGQMVRLIEGVRLHRELPGSKLILSGDRDCADGMLSTSEALGVSVADIRLLANPKDTEEESRQVAPIVGRQRFILVTSAAHMPRAMMLFHHQGLQPIPAPTDYLAPRHPYQPDDIIPNAHHLYLSQVAFYEYLGKAWETLRGR